MPSKRKTLHDKAVFLERKLDPKQKERIEKVHNKVERLAEKGIVDRPEYQLASSSPLSFISANFA